MNEFQEMNELLEMDDFQNEDEGDLVARFSHSTMSESSDGDIQIRADSTESNENNEVEMQSRVWPEPLACLNGNDISHIFQFFGEIECFQFLISYNVVRTEEDFQLLQRLSNNQNPNKRGYYPSQIVSVNLNVPTFPSRNRNNNFTRNLFVMLREHCMDLLRFNHLCIPLPCGHLLIETMKQLFDSEKKPYYFLSERNFTLILREIVKTVEKSVKDYSRWNSNQLIAEFYYLASLMFIYRELSSLEYFESNIFDIHWSKRMQDLSKLLETNESFIKWFIERIFRFIESELFMIPDLRDVLCIIMKRILMFQWNPESYFSEIAQFKEHSFLELVEIEIQKEIIFRNPSMTTPSLTTAAVPSLTNLVFNPSIDDTNFIIELRKLFPELDLYQDMDELTPDALSHTVLHPKPNLILFNAVYNNNENNKNIIIISDFMITEMNKFFIRLLYLRDLLRDENRFFPNLSKENFTKLRQFLLHSRRRMTEREREEEFRFLFYSLIIDDLGRTKKFRGEVNKYEKKDTKANVYDHDEYLKRFFQYFHRCKSMSLFQHYLPSFQSLSANHQSQYLNQISNTFNLGAFVQGESVPFSLYQFFGSCPTLVERKYRLLVQILSFAAVRHSQDFHSMIFNDFYFSQFMTAIEIICEKDEPIISPDLTRQIYSKYLRARAPFSMKPEDFFPSAFSEEERYALYRIFALTRSSRREQLYQILFVWKELSRKIQTTLIKFLNHTGFTEETAIYIYYAPAIIANTVDAFRNNVLSPSGCFEGMPDPFVQGIFYALQEIMKIYERTEDDLREKRIKPCGKINDSMGGMFIYYAQHIAERVKEFPNILKQLVVRNRENSSTETVSEEYELFHT